mgnify:FL=1
MGDARKSNETRLSWKKCAIWGILITPLTMLLLYFVMGFLPEQLERLIRQNMLDNPLLFGLVFYLCGVAVYRWVGLDLSKKEDWPDIPG